MRTPNRLRLSAGLFATLLTVSLPQPLPAMTADEFQRLGPEGAQQYFFDMIAVGQQVLRDAGRDDDAKGLEAFPGESAFESQPNGPTGAQLFLSNLKKATYRKELAAVQDPAIRPLEVEFTFFMTLRDAKPGLSPDCSDIVDKEEAGHCLLSDLDISLPPSFLQVAKAGRIRGAALAARIDTTAQLLAGAFNVITGGELQPRQDKPAYSGTSPEARYDADPVPENARRATIADLPEIGRVIATGTVSSIERKNAYAVLHFRGAVNLVCFPESAFQGLFGMKDYTELTGKTVEVRGDVTLPQGCFGSAGSGALKLASPKQIKLLGDAAAGR